MVKMAIYRRKIDPSYIEITNDTVYYRNLFNHPGRVWLINPTVVGVQSDLSNLTAETFSSDFSAPAASCSLQSFISNGWGGDLESISSSINTFLSSNIGLWTSETNDLNYVVSVGDTHVVAFIYSGSDPAEDGYLNTLNEIQSLTFEDQTGSISDNPDGTFTLDFNGQVTSAISFATYPFLDSATNKEKFTQEVRSVAVQSDGKILVGGSFTDYEEDSRDRLVRLNSDGTLDTAFVNNAVDGNKFSSTVISMAVQSDGKIIVGGNFFGYGYTSGRNRLIRLNSDGTLDTAFANNAVDGSKFNDNVFSTAVQSDGKILVGGGFSNYGGFSGRNRLIRLNSDGTLDTAFANNAVDGKFASNTGNIASIAVQSDGKILVGGYFTNYGGFSGRNRLIRLNSDGTLDTAFVNNAVDGNKISSGVQSLAVQSDGKILVGGSQLGRLNSDGTRDLAFDSTLLNIDNGSVESIAVQSDGKILVGGTFTNYEEDSRDRLVRLNSDGTIDIDFAINASDYSKFTDAIRSVAVQSDGKILVGGSFTDYGGIIGCNRFVRLNADGTTLRVFDVNTLRTNIQSALEALSNIGLGNTNVTVFTNGSALVDIRVEFINYTGLQNQPELVVDSNSVVTQYYISNNPVTISCSTVTNGAGLELRISQPISGGSAYIWWKGADPENRYQYIGQSFTIVDPITLGNIALQLYRGAETITGGTIVVDVYEASGDVPSVLVGVSNPFDATLITEEPRWFVFTFNGIELGNYGSKYVFVVRSYAMSGDDNSAIYINLTYTNEYGFGVYLTDFTNPPTTTFNDMGLTFGIFSTT
jgi:uncharacterized delta-60 repeat protein